MHLHHCGTEGVWYSEKFGISSFLRASCTTVMIFTSLSVQYSGFHYSAALLYNVCIMTVQNET